MAEFRVKCANDHFYDLSVSDYTLKEAKIRPQPLVGKCPACPAKESEQALIIEVPPDNIPKIKLMK